MQARIAQADALLHRYQVSVLLGFRFVYGIRNATPFVAGSIATIPVWRFVALNAAGAAIWSTSVPAVGYFFGHTADQLLGAHAVYGPRTLIAIAFVALSVWMIRYLRARHRAARSTATDAANPPHTQ